MLNGTDVAGAHRRHAPHAVPGGTNSWRCGRMLRCYSRGFHNGVKVRAMNSVEEWGASDHCRVLIEVSGGS